MRRVEWWMYQQRGSAGRWGEERQRRAESPSGGRAWGHSRWRLGSTQMARGGPPERRGERAWPGRARRQARVGRHRGSGVAAAVVDERGIGKASQGRRAARGAGRVDRTARGAGGVDGAVRGAGRVEGAAGTGKQWGRGRMGCRQRRKSWHRGGGGPNRTRGGSQDRWVRWSQQGETHLRRRRDER
jgi:hypothetical protein